MLCVCAGETNKAATEAAAAAAAATSIRSKVNIRASERRLMMADTIGAAAAAVGGPVDAVMTPEKGRQRQQRWLISLSLFLIKRKNNS